MKYLYKWVNLQGTGKYINKFWKYLNYYEIKPIKAV